MVHAPVVLVVSAARAADALRGGWKGHPVVVVGSLDDVPEKLHLMVAAVALPVKQRALTQARPPFCLVFDTFSGCDWFSDWVLLGLGFCSYVVGFFSFFLQTVCWLPLTALALLSLFRLVSVSRLFVAFA